MQRARGTDRILDIIECVARLNRPVSRADVAHETGMPRSTVYALTDILLERAWLEESDSRLLLGPQAGFVSNAYLRERGFEAMARDVLSAMAAETGVLAELDVVEDWLHVVAISEGSLAQGYISPIEGARLPLMPTAAARVMLADLTEAQILASVREGELVDVPGQPVTMAEFLDQLRLYRAQGYTTVTGWFDGTVSTLACPVRDGEGRTMASVCFIVPTAELNRRRAFFLDQLMRGAEALSALLRRMRWVYAERCWHKLHSDTPRGVTALGSSGFRG